VAEGEADAVFGSRMMERGGALKGGMPLYKYVGNKILTAAQNALLGSKLSEFHSGYRSYAVETLKKIPFRLNSNDFHFDTEIIIQLVNLQARIAEIAIPTFYGDEICRVDGMKYAKDVMIATLKNFAHRRGVLYQRRFDVESGNTRYAPKLGYASSHTYAIDAVTPGAKVVDLGGGPGDIARELSSKGCEIRVLDQMALAVADPHISSEVFDLDAGKPVEIKDAEFILLLDMVEHLASPETFFEKLRQSFDFQPRTLVLSTANIAFFVQRVQLLLGEFNYGRAGILDFTHRRLFTFRGVKQLLDDAGFRDIKLRGVPAPFPKVLGNGVLGQTAIRLNLMLIRLSPALFSYQIFATATSTPSAEFVLSDTKRRGHEVVPPKAVGV
jgi:2-polyprenyl-3-methyl-5-hydroxy-6-metoxy-1,4-benzoquinol methylase